VHLFLDPQVLRNSREEDEALSRHEGVGCGEECKAIRDLPSSVDLPLFSEFQEHRMLSVCD
jgi:hypothetical protein